MADNRPTGPAKLDEGERVGFIAQTASLATEVRKHGAWALMQLVGLAFIFVALVSKFGPYEFEANGPPAFVFGVGLALLLTGIVGFLTQRAAESKKFRRLVDLAPQPDFIDTVPGEVTDTAFLMEVFQCMPPAFVKRQEDDGLFEDIMFNRAFTRFQDSPATAPVAQDERLSLIRQDHQAGDRVALREGSSLQVEYPASVVHGKLRPILTFKRRFEHRGIAYIAGWYVPVVATDLPGSDSMCLREEVDQVVFKVALADSDDDGLRANVGKALTSLK